MRPSGLRLPLFRTLIRVLLGSSLACLAPVMAQVGPTKPAASTPAARSSSGWSTLSTDQRAALRPLATDWDRLSEAQQRKWIALSQNFARMTPAEQATLHSRMRDWIALSPQQRSQARLNFAEASKLPADEKKAKWEAYQALSADEKKRLGASAPQAGGAAPALRPIPQQKLVPVPESKLARLPATKASSAQRTASAVARPSKPLASGASASASPTR